MHINQTHHDPAMREIFSNKDFRIGLSYAIDRQSIIDLVFAGQGEPYQIAPRPESEFYDEEFGKQFTEYSVEKANEYLDKVVLPNKDGEGFRLRPDGNRLSFVITVREDRQAMVDTAPLVAEYWRAVGVDVQFRAMEKSAYLNQRNSNLHDSLIDDGDGGMLDAMLLPRAYIPINLDGAWGTAWINWVTGATRGDKMEPPPRIQAALDVYAEMQKGARHEGGAEGPLTGRCSVSRRRTSTAWASGCRSPSTAPPRRACTTWPSRRSGAAGCSPIRARASRRSTSSRKKSRADYSSASPAT